MKVFIFHLPILVLFTLDSLWSMKKPSPISPLQYFKKLKKKNKQVPRDAIRKGLFAGYKDEKGYTPLHIAALHGLTPILCHYLSYQSRNFNVDDKNFAGETALHLAAQEGNIDCVRVLLAVDADQSVINKKNETALHLAAKKGHVKTFKILFLAGGEKFLTQEQSFDLANEIDNLIIIELLHGQSKIDADESLEGPEDENSSSDEDFSSEDQDA